MRRGNRRVTKNQCYTQHFFNVNSHWSTRFTVVLELKSQSCFYWDGWKMKGKKEPVLHSTFLFGGIMSLCNELTFGWTGRGIFTQKSQTSTSRPGNRRMKKNQCYSHPFLKEELSTCMALTLGRRQENQQDYETWKQKSDKEPVLHSSFFQGKQSLVYKTYCVVGVDVLELILLGGLEIEGCKKASFTLNLFLSSNNILVYCTDF